MYQVIFQYVNLQYIHSLLIFRRKKRLNCVLRGTLGPPRGRNIYCQSTLWLAVALRGEIFYSTSCLNKEEHVFAYCSIVLHLPGHEKQRQKWLFPMFFSTFIVLTQIAKKRFRTWHHCSKLIVSLHLLWCTLASTQNIFKEQL